MPPEQILNFKDVKETSDIFSMGMTLYYALTAKLPFNFPSPFEIQNYIVKKELFSLDTLEVLNHMGFQGNPFLVSLIHDIIPIEERIPDLPDRLAKTINRSIQKISDDRYQTAEAFRMDLLECLNCVPI